MIPRPVPDERGGHPPPCNRACARFEPRRSFEVFVTTPLAVAQARDPKGLYRLARSGALAGLTGVDGPYEPAERAATRLVARLA